MGVHLLIHGGAFIDSWGCIYSGATNVRDELEAVPKAGAEAPPARGMFG